MLKRDAKEGDRKVDEVCPIEEEAREEAPGGEGAQEGEEAREVRAPPIPDTPSREQVRAHRLTHRPFRSWCIFASGEKGEAIRINSRARRMWNQKSLR